MTTLGVLVVLLCSICLTSLVSGQLALVGEALMGALGSAGAAGAGGAAAAGAEGAAAAGAAGAGSGIMAGLGQVFGDALAPQITKLVTGLGDSLAHALFDKSPYQTVGGRSVKVSQNGNVATIHDLASGMTVVGHGDTSEEAFAEASAKFITTLYQAGVISKDDLHLAPVYTTTEKPCGDALPNAVCPIYKSNGYCSPTHVLHKFMMRHCGTTCTGC